MALLATLEANHEVRIDFIAIRILIRFTRTHCVTCFLVRWEIARSGFLTRDRVLLFWQRSLLFLGIAISSRLPASWGVRLLPRGAVLTAIVLAIVPPDIELSRGNVAAAFECTGSERRAASLACAMRTACCHSSIRLARSRIK